MNSIATNDCAEQLARTLKHCADEREPVRIVGNDSKRFYGRHVDARVLSIGEHRGIVSYDPTELVMTVRTGTLVTEVEAELANHGQMLGFDSPLFAANATIGGTVAAGIAGPRRPFAGALRDFVLGAKVLDGRGTMLKFGGVVFKNVAGFDAFRLMVGSLGCLAVILEVSLRVAPAPKAERALVLELDAAGALRYLTQKLKSAQPMSGACHDGHRLHVRLSGGEAAVEEAAREFGGEVEDPGFWQGVRHLSLPFFRNQPRLWRLSVPATAEPIAVAGESFWDWAGALRWLATDAPAEAVRAAAAKVGGHATLFKGASNNEDIFTPLPANVLALHRRLKAKFDPHGILNPGRMYAEL